MPGTKTRALDFDRALSFNYQVGGVNSALLLGGGDVCGTDGGHRPPSLREGRS